ncbi:MAG: response regulator transcription factor, partial [Bradyrhizobium sp.]
MKTILVVDDDASIGALLTDVLTREGYRVLRAYSGTEALLVLRTERPDLVLLDLMLPGLTGEEVLAQLAGIPVIVVSARVGVDDKVDDLLGGAADYITKPFDTRELLARIAVQLRAAPLRTDAQPLTFDAITLDPARRTVTVAGEPVRLTKTEYAILKRLMLNPSQVL